MFQSLGLVWYLHRSIVRLSFLIGEVLVLVLWRGTLDTWMFGQAFPRLTSGGGSGKKAPWGGELGIGFGGTECGSWLGLWGGEGMVMRESTVGTFWMVSKVVCDVLVMLRLRGVCEGV